MDDFKILVCEDLNQNVRDIKLYLNKLKSEMQGVNIDYKIVDFNGIYDELIVEYNLLILDLINEDTGYEGGNVLKHNIKQIPTLIYTSRGDEVMFDLNENKKAYPFILDKLTRLQNGNNLQSYIKQYILRKDIIKPVYSLYNENDLILINSLITIGEGNFKEIIFQIAEKFNTSKIVVYRMTSGLSGAILFKIENEGEYFILKLSKEIDKLKEEHSNAVEMYHKFPNRLINHIDSEEYYSYDAGVLGILLKEVDHSKTLFDFLLNPATSKTKIRKFFKNLFIDEQGLKYHYQNNQKQFDDWTSIFAKINEQKIFLINKSFEELKPIIHKYYNLFDVEDFRRLTVIHNYNLLNKNNLLEAKFKKKLVLGHGDLHSKNILIQSESHPVLIDTGSISYQHWCLDICRLITHLFINGIDFGTVEFYDIQSIPRYIDIVEKLLVRENLNLDGKNDNIYHAINWLIKNIDDIFKPDYELFEFQLGLMKEFLQISYRFDSIPPNKRALALIAADKCMIKANENVKLA